MVYKNVTEIVSKIKSHKKKVKMPFVLKPTEKDVNDSGIKWAHDKNAYRAAKERLRAKVGSAEEAQLREYLFESMPREGADKMIRQYGSAREAWAVKQMMDRGIKIDKIYGRMSAQGSAVNARDFEMLRLFKIINKGFFPLRSNNKCMEFLYVENLVDACILVMNKGINGEFYHVSNGEHYSINEIVGTIAKAENKKILPIKLPSFIFVLGGWKIELIGKIFNFHPPFKHDTVEWMTKKFWYSDITKIKKLGYNPKINLVEGVKRTVDYYKARGFIN